MMTPCIHRGEVWREAINKLCGYRGQPEPVYRCRLHTICTHRKYKHGQPEQVCLACDDYTTTEATNGEQDTAPDSG
jgi:hypothetical protein